MNITELELVNFRNYSKTKIKLNPKLNIFIGNNGQGKTNILEAIYILAITKSNRFGDQITLIKNDCEKAIIKGKLNKNKIKNNLKIEIFKNNKNIFIDNNEIKKFSDYLTKFNIILFSPDDLEIIKGSPHVRRNYLNIEISQINSKYLNILNEYNKILKIRNDYLKKMNISALKDIRYLDIITDKLIERSYQIYKYRYNYIFDINNNISNIYKEISNLDNLKINYINCTETDELLNIEDYTFLLKDLFKKNLNKELQIGNTLYGIHRDDYKFVVNDFDYKTYGSQGSQRLAIISMKLAEIDIFKENTDFYPILLLDDIFSEIDNNKKSKLIKYLDRNLQTIITTTDLKNINKKLLINAKVFKVDNGKICEKVD